MGCSLISKFCPPLSRPSHRDELTWSRRLMSSGADKDIFRGKYCSHNVAVCVAQPQGGGTRRLQNEIKVFKRLGCHPNIIHMYYGGSIGRHTVLVLEIVEPIGYDLDRLNNMYAFTGQAVPSLLMGQIFKQLASALMHMHNQGIIHRDLKSENVLIDANHNAKLIDMGIACKLGTKGPLRAGYLAPEVCRGSQPLGIEVDSWGLGLILHQIYQKQWNLLTSTGPVRMLKGRPSDLWSMEKPVREAMCNLLKFEPSERWTVKELETSEWLTGSRAQAPDASNNWQRHEAVEDRECQYLRPYKSNKPLPTALAVFISTKNHAHLIGMPINALGLGSLGITVLLICYGRGTFERVPSADTTITENSWFYFGVPQTDGEMMKGVQGLLHILNGAGKARDFQRNFRALSRKEVIETGKLVEFTVEFDCFPFPRHIGAKAVIGLNSEEGPAPKGEHRLIGLNLRRLFKVNLVGIHRLGEADPQWFPGAQSTVSPKDLGLVIRQPCSDGSTMSTLTDQDFEAFMNEDQFQQHMGVPAARMETQGAQSPLKPQQIRALHSQPILAPSASWRDGAPDSPVVS